MSGKNGVEDGTAQPKSELFKVHLCR